MHQDVDRSGVAYPRFTVLVDLRYLFRRPNLLAQSFYE